MTSQLPIIFVLGSPAAGKTTLCTHLTADFPVQHISVGNLLRRIKNDAKHPYAATIADALAKQDLIEASILFAVLQEEMEELSKQKPGKKAIVIDGFPRNDAQRKEFEEVFGEPKLVLLFDCPKEVAKQRYLTRNLEGREADDEAMFEKRYEEYVRQKAVIEGGYMDRGCMMVVDTSSKTDHSLRKLYQALWENEKWMDAIGAGVR